MENLEFGLKEANSTSQGSSPTKQHSPNLRVAHLVIGRTLHHLVSGGVHHPGRDVLVQEEQRLARVATTGGETTSESARPSMIDRDEIAMKPLGNRDETVGKP